MPRYELTNHPRSVRDRLVVLAEKQGRPFNELHQFFAIERFLFRLSISKHAGKFVLRGGLLLRVWNAPITRPTKDVDFLVRTKMSAATLRSIIREVCCVEVLPDGVEFDVDSVQGGALTSEHSEAVRLKFIARLGKARLYMQVDVGFGDLVVPEPIRIELPVLLDYPAPKLVAYRPETAIAEKFHAMVVLGERTGRMKDFYDVWLLSSNREYEATVLAQAIAATFSSRSTEPELDPVALEQEFAESPNAQRQWTAFLTKRALDDAPRSFAEVVSAVREFVLPVLSDSGGRWIPGKGWV